MSWLPDLAPSARLCAAVRRDDSAITLLAAVEQLSDAPIVPRGDLFHYHWWHDEQTAIDFWLAAYSWTLYWDAVLLGDRGDPAWMDQIMNPLPIPPMLGFLGISGGRIAWDFQLELTYRLGDGDRQRASAFRKGWTAQLPAAVARARSLVLPDGATLYETIERHSAYPFASCVASVPIRAGHLLVKT